MFFNSGMMLVKTLAAGTLCYLWVLVLLRWFGKRSMSKWNAFDWIVSVAMGSTLASCLLSKDVSVAQGFLAFLLLLSFQFAVTWLSVRSAAISHLVKARPTLLLRDGQMQQHAMRAQRVTESEVLAALRAHGVASEKEARAVVLETDGSFSVVKSSSAGASTMRDVHGYEGG